MLCSSACDAAAAARDMCNVLAMPGAKRIKLAVKAQLPALERRELQSELYAAARERQVHVGSTSTLTSKELLYAGRRYLEENVGPSNT